jgi:hypothetical protein
MPVIQDLPLLPLALVCLVGTVGVGIGGVLLVRHKRWHIPERDIGTAAALHALIGVLYAVALGLLVVRVEEAYDAVQSVTDAEAIAAGDLYRTLGGLPDSVSKGIRQDIRGYLSLVVKNEWPATRRGEPSPETWRSIDLIGRKTIAYTPVSQKEQLIYPQVLTNMQSLLDARRERIFRGENGIEPMTWIVIFIGALVTIGGACFFSMEHKTVHYMLIGFASSMLGMMIFLVVAMDRPLRGGFSVDPDAFVKQQAILAQYDKEEAVR